MALLNSSVYNIHFLGQLLSKPSFSLPPYLSFPPSYFPQQTSILLLWSDFVTANTKVNFKLSNLGPRVALHPIYLPRCVVFPLYLLPTFRGLCHLWLGFLNPSSQLDISPFPIYPPVLFGADQKVISNNRNLFILFLYI